MHVRIAPQLTFNFTRLVVFWLQGGQVGMLVVLIAVGLTALAALRRRKARCEAARPSAPKVTTRTKKGDKKKGEKKCGHWELWSALDGAHAEASSKGSAGSFDEWRSLWKSLRPDFDRHFAGLEANMPVSPSVLCVALTVGTDPLPRSLSLPLAAASDEVDEDSRYRFDLQDYHECEAKWLKAAETIIHSGSGKHAHNPFCAKHPKISGVALQVWHHKVHLVVWPRSHKVLLTHVFTTASFCSHIRLGPPRLRIHIVTASWRSCRKRNARCSPQVFERSSTSLIAFLLNHHESAPQSSASTIPLLHSIRYCPWRRMTLTWMISTRRSRPPAAARAWQ
jgi:hypothetical protein